MKIAAQLHTVREFLQTPEQIAESLHKVKKMGYNAVQLSSLGYIDPEELKTLVDKEGLEICATHIPYLDMKNHIDQVIETHNLWNCKYVGLGGLPKEYRSSAESYSSFAKEASEIGRSLHNAGLKLIYHNHDFEFIKFGDKTGLQILLEQSDPYLVEFELDLYWVQAGGGDPIEWINKVKGRMSVVHFKDMSVNAERQQLFAEIGEGNMNYTGIISACREIGVNWAVVEQDRCLGNPFDSLELSLRNLTRMGVEV